MRRSLLIAGSACLTVVAAAVVIGFVRPSGISDLRSSSQALLHSSGVQAVMHPSSVIPVSAATGGNTIAGCEILPHDNIWNTPVDGLPLDPKSSTYIASIGLDTKVHPDFGHDLLNGIPITIIPRGTRGVKMDYLYRDDSDLQNYPIPPGALQEGGGAKGNDSHVILIDPRRCLLFEFWDAHPRPDGSWHVGSAARYDLTSNQLRDDGKTSADAAGLPILPGLMRYDEVASGEIHHAIRFTIPKTRKAHIWPARHDASSLTDPKFPPMGMRMRLKASFDISGYPQVDQVILRAMNRYGIILADNGSAIFLSGIPDARWNDDELHHLGQVTGKDFEVVDESAWEMMGDSGRVDPLEFEQTRKK